MHARHGSRIMQRPDRLTVCRSGSRIPEHCRCVRHTSTIIRPAPDEHDDGASDAVRRENTAGIRGTQPHGKHESAIAVSKPQLANLTRSYHTHRGADSTAAHSEPATPTEPQRQKRK